LRKRRRRRRAAQRDRRHGLRHLSQMREARGQKWLDRDTTEVAERRKLILGIANELSLKVIDSYDVLRNGKENELWYPEQHHTPLGNELVCSYLFEQGFSKQTSTFRSNSPSTILVKASALNQ
jgi:hypothetical protein